MACPECGGEMETKEEVSCDYFLIVTTRRNYYEYEKCTSCGYETEKRLVASRSITGVTDYDEDKENE